MPGRDDRDDDPGGGVVAAVQRASVAEVRRQIDDTSERVVRLEVRVDTNTEHLAEVRESQARIEGQMVHLVGAYERAANVVANQALADLEIKKADALAQIKDRAAERKQRREVRKELIFKAITIAMGAWTILSAVLAGAKC